MNLDSDAIFSALADSNRRALLGVIGDDEELTVGDLADRIDGIGRTAISAHLRVLRLAGLVTERREGRYRFYSLTSSPAEAVVSFLAYIYRNSLEHLTSAVEDASAGLEQDKGIA